MEDLIKKCKSDSTTLGDDISTVLEKKSLVMFAFTKGETFECYDYEELRHWLEEGQQKLFYWPRRDRRVYKLMYSGVWVDQTVLDLIFKDGFSTILLNFKHNHAIGSNYGVSATHGEIYSIYTGIPISRVSLTEIKKIQDVFANIKFGDDDVLKIPEKLPTKVEREDFYDEEVVDEGDEEQEEQYDVREEEDDETPRNIAPGWILEGVYLTIEDETLIDDQGIISMNALDMVLPLFTPNNRRITNITISHISMKKMKNLQRILNIDTGFRSIVLRIEDTELSEIDVSELQGVSSMTIRNSKISKIEEDVDSLNVSFISIQNNPYNSEPFNYIKCKTFFLILTKIQIVLERPDSSEPKVRYIGTELFIRGGEKESFTDPLIIGGVSGNVSKIVRESLKGEPLLSSISNLERFTNLKVLNVSASRITEIDSILNAVKTLEYLDVSCTLVKKLPANLKDSKLKQLDLSSTPFNFDFEKGLVTIPDGFSKWTNIGRRGTMDGFALHIFRPNHRYDNEIFQAIDEEEEDDEDEEEEDEEDEEDEEEEDEQSDENRWDEEALSD